MAFSPFAQPLTKVADTGLPGAALQNGTPVLVTWTAPNDGQMHFVLALAEQHVTVAETGGAVTLSASTPDGGASVNAGVFAGGSGVGGAAAFTARFLAPGATLTIQQTSALTVGAAVVWAQLWAA